MCIKELEIDTFVSELESKMLQFEQADCPVVHKFGPGIYIREVRMPAGALAIGHYQKFSHLNLFLEGRITMLNNNGTRVEKIAPMTFVGEPGRKIGYIHENVVWLNIYATDETDIETLEATYLDKSKVWLDHEKKVTSIQKLIDVEDYKKILLEHNLTEEQARKETENESDQIQMPHGSYKFLVSKSNIEGRGVFASAEIKPLEIIGPVKILDKRTPLGRFTNHSSDPNARMVKFNDYIGLVATKVIKGCSGGFPGEEITTDYRNNLRLVGREPCQQLPQP